MHSMSPKMTTTTRMVLLSFLQDPDAELYGRQIIAMTGLAPGTVYPILSRLCGAGWLVDRPEHASASSTGGARRRYYQLTSDGWDTARREQAAADLRARMTATKETTTWAADLR